MPSNYLFLLEWLMGRRGGGGGRGGGGARKGTRNEEITQVKKHDAHLQLLRKGLLFLTAEVTPIPNEGDHEQASNNRPISLLPVLS